MCIFQHKLLVFKVDSLSNSSKFHGVLAEKTVTAAASRHAATMTPLMNDTIREETKIKRAMLKFKLPSFTLFNAKTSGSLKGEL